MNISKSLLFGYKELKTSNIKTYLLDTELLLSEALKCSREIIMLNPNMKINGNSFKLFFRNIQRRKKGEPIAYIIKKKEFWKNNFFVNKNVLIPRPETEHLVEQILEHTSKEKRIKILEIGVGSGCISISILKELKYSQVTAIDVSQSALKIAKINAILHHLQNRIKFFKRDIDNFCSGKYDLIVSNPPYIEKKKIKYLDVANYEPWPAIDGGLDGLSILNKVIIRSKKLLKNNGKLFLEIGYNQKYRMIHLLKKNKFFVNKVIKDYGNKDRCIVSTKIS